jgi:hypothetical protein
MGFEINSMIENCMSKKIEKENELKEEFKKVLNVSDEEIEMLVKSISDGIFNIPVLKLAFPEIKFNLTP